MRWVRLAIFILVVVGGGSLIGGLTRPGEWYTALEKPFFDPPNWLFGVVWPVLYVIIAVAGWRVWERRPGGMAMRLWALQLALNFAWSPVFFVAHSIAGALAIVLALFVTIVAFMVVAARVDRGAAALFAPYAAWVAFATLLNAAILWLN